MDNFPGKLIDLYLSLFKGRTDIYAKRWEKEGSSGYMPAYKVNWEAYRKHKAQGGTFKNFKNKEYLPFTKEAVLEHLKGQQTLGIYPLLEDNTSYFIAADFDKKNWKEECITFLQTCAKYNIPAYLEKSRSGNGAHIWIFFEDRYPAQKSRKIVFELLRQSEIISEFDKDGSFDRLFPNQDKLTNLGFGNLIALPLNGKSLKEGNTCFLNPKSFLPYSDQWLFIASVQKASLAQLDKIYIELFGKDSDSGFFTKAPIITSTIEITLKDQVYLKRIQLNPRLKAFLREHLNFINADYIIKKKLGRSVFKTEKFFKLIEEMDGEVLIPRGFVGQLVSFCKKEGFGYNILDKRKKKKAIKFSSSIGLYDYQEKALIAAEKKDFGVIVAPPGSGKTIISLEIIARKRQPSLIIVHRKQLFDQWMDRIQSFLNIPKHEIGQITTGKKTISNKITVAMIQSLKKMRLKESIGDKFGLIIVDECHHIPAKTFRETITLFNPYYLYGITATPIRKNNDEQLIFVYIGNIIAKIEPVEISNQGSLLEIKIVASTLSVPFDYRIDEYETLSNVLIYDSVRNNLIAKDITAFVKDKRSILVLSERKAHLNVLNLYLKDKFETIEISGEDSMRSRKSKMEQIQMGHFQIVLSTGQFLGEGIDIPSFNCLFLVYPFAFEGKLIQYIGRVQRSDNPPAIIDYRDKQVAYLEKLFKKRNRYYNKLRKMNLAKYIE